MIDKLLNPSAGQAIGTGTTAVLSTDSIDLGSGRDIGKGAPVYAHVQVTNQPAGSGYTLQCELVQSDNADLSSCDALLSSGAIAVAAIKPGYRFRFGSIPPGLVTKRYLGFRYTQGGTPSTGAVVTAALEQDVQTGYGSFV